MGKKGGKNLQMMAHCTIFFVVVLFLALALGSLKQC